MTYPYRSVWLQHQKGTEVALEVSLLRRQNLQQDPWGTTYPIPCWSAWMFTGFWMAQERSKESVEYRCKTGGNLGGRPKPSNKKESLVIRLRSEGESYRSIQDQTGLALATINRIIKDINRIMMSKSKMSFAAGIWMIKDGTYVWWYE